MSKGVITGYWRRRLKTVLLCDWGSSLSFADSSDNTLALINLSWDFNTCIGIQGVSGCALVIFYHDRSLIVHLILLAYSRPIFNF